MRTLTWMCGNTFRDVIQNEYTRKNFKLWILVKRENWLHWFGHVRLRPVRCSSKERGEFGFWGFLEKSREA